MTFTSKILFATTVILASMVGIGSVWAQNKGDRSINQFTCKDIMRETGTNREVDIAFLHGYLLGKAGTPKFNIDDLLKQTDAFVDKCLDNPTAKALDVMIGVKK